MAVLSRAGSPCSLRDGFSPTIPKACGFEAATQLLLERESLEKLLAEPGAINDKLELRWIGCGRKDFLFERNQKFFERLSKEKIDYVAHITDGAREWRLWRIYLSEFVPPLFRLDM